MNRRTLQVSVAWTIATALSVGSAQTPSSDPPAPPKPIPKAVVKKSAAKPTPKGVGKPSAKPAPIKPPVSDEPKILSADESARRSDSRKALAGDGGTRYDSVDWSEIPAWRQTAFYGIRAKGQTFIYVVDCSGSMDDEDRLDRAKRELRRTVQSLQFPQRFKVIFYNDEPLPMPGDLPKSADSVSKEQLARWLHLIEADGGTDPRLSMKMALSLKPDAVFLLSDGAFPDGTDTALAASNHNKIPIHCIDLSGGAGGDQLKAIAKASGGQYVARP